MVVAAYDAQHAVILLTDATERHNHRTRWRQKLPMFELMRSNIIERPESCVLTRARARFANISNGAYPGLYWDRPCGDQYVDGLNLGNYFTARYTPFATISFHNFSDTGVSLMRKPGIKACEGSHTLGQYCTCSLKRLMLPTFKTANRPFGFFRNSTYLRTSSIAAHRSGP